MAAFGVKALEILRQTGIKIGLMAATLIIGFFVVKLAAKFARYLLKRARVDNAVANFAVSLIKSAFWLVIIFLVGYFAGIPITALVAIVSAATVAIGLALQGSLSNLASGIIIAVTKPFKEGDFVDTGVVMGKVVNIKLFTTEMVTIDNKKIVVPNSTIASSNITNSTNQARRMINMSVPVNYSSDIALVENTLLGIVNNNEKVIKDPAPLCKLHEYSASSINFILRAWTLTEDYWEVYWQLNEEVILKFRENGIEIPYTKIDVFMQGRQDK